MDKKIQSRARTEKKSKWDLMHHLFSFSGDEIQIKGSIWRQRDLIKPSGICIQLGFRSSTPRTSRPKTMTNENGNYDLKMSRDKKMARYLNTLFNCISLSSLILCNRFVIQNMPQGRKKSYDLCLSQK